MKDSKKKNAVNEKIDLQADALTDLPLADEQAEETKGGATPKLMLACATGSH